MKQTDKPADQRHSIGERCLKELQNSLVRRQRLVDLKRHEERQYETVVTCVGQRYQHELLAWPYVQIVRFHGELHSSNNDVASSMNNYSVNVFNINPNGYYYTLHVNACS